MKKLQFGSQCVRAARDTKTTRPHQLPIYATSSFAFEDLPEGMAVFSGEQQGHLYSRFGNPTIDAVTEKVAQLEMHGSSEAGRGLFCSSGMSAISTLCLGLLQPGDAILTQPNLYGGTNELFQKVLQPLGFRVVMADLSDLNAVAETLAQHPAIRMVYFETPANPTLSCVDIEALSNLAHAQGALSVADNTFATPYLQQPLLLGADYVVHSTTKYLNGHGNSTAGAIVGKDLEAMQERVFPALKLLGTNGSPFEAWLLNNGMKTLELRMERHCKNAAKVAKWLIQQPQVSRVNYPGLPDHPDHQLASRQMRHFGGMVSFELKGGLDAGRQFVEGLELCTLAPTMGDVDTLIMHPATMSHLKVPVEQRLAAGISDGLIRLSVGIENIEDIRSDLEKGMAAIKSER
ncbi:MAG: PLP-dependent aspartate aminotransferase family protein [Phaeodactylibacter sp.]|uniref:trans-sulfuration enzyme family protein n=1 Tax=Phaeodactylibacter sp. TaxID=1940289 RepID=UPI0032EEE69D